jgi:hypothetical protein
MSDESLQPFVAGATKGLIANDLQIEATWPRLPS